MKYLILGVVLFVTYRLMFRPSLMPPKKKDSIKESNNEFSEYEEIE